MDPRRDGVPSRRGVTPDLSRVVDISDPIGPPMQGVVMSVH
jgi:hypothetical protein